MDALALPARVHEGEVAVTLAEVKARPWLWRLPSRDSVAPSPGEDSPASPRTPPASPPPRAPAPACVPEAEAEGGEEAPEDGCWAALPVELVEAVFRLLDAGCREWPARGALCAACGVCRAWRSVGLHATAPLHWTASAPHSDFATPARLLVPGPASSPVKCFVQRERVKGSLKRRYLLFLGSSADGLQRGKFLLCATRQPAALCSVYDLSTSTGGEAGSVVAQLRSNFLGTQFHIVQRDSLTSAAAAAFPPPGAPPPAPPPPPPPPAAAAQLPDAQEGCPEGVESTAESAVAAPSTPPSSGSTVVGALSYDCNIWTHRGPRRMAVALSNPLLPPLVAAGADAASVLLDGEHGALVPDAAAPAGEAGDAQTHAGGSLEPPLAGAEPAEPAPAPEAALLAVQPPPGASAQESFAVLRNKAPRWHDTYQCWCLDFGGRVTTASVKNFQLTAQNHSRVLMQFGRTGNKDVFVMDYEHPLSAVQAFAVCLSAFDSKLACR